MDKKAAVVILNYNGRGFLEKFLPTVLRYSHPHTVIVADNASSDDSISFLESTFPSVQLIKIPENLGYAGGYNYAIKDLDFDYFILLNSDIEVTENWIDPVLALLDSDQSIAACQPKIRSYQKKELFEYAGAAGGFIDYLGYPFCRGRIFKELEKDNGQYDQNVEVFWATGACLFVRASDFKRQAGFDENFFAHMEEIDLCWRFKNEGKKIFYCSESTVHHVGGGTLQSESPFKTFLNFRNNWLLLYKNLSLAEFDGIANKRLILDYLAAIQFFLSGKFKNATAILRAHRAFKQYKPSYKANQKPGLTHKQIYRKSIIADYFFRGIKKFSSIEFSR